MCQERCGAREWRESAWILRRNNCPAAAHGTSTYSPAQERPACHGQRPADANGYETAREGLWTRARVGAAKPRTRPACRHVRRCDGARHRQPVGLPGNPRAVVAAGAARGRTPHDAIVSCTGSQGHPMRGRIRRAARLQARANGRAWRAAGLAIEVEIAAPDARLCPSRGTVRVCNDVSCLHSFG